MKILALEFSTDRRSVAVAVDGAVRAQAAEANGRAGHPLRLTEAVLSEAGLQPEGIECVAVGLGPGSYHGIRSAIALAQGWELARGVAVCGVSSVAAIAFEAQRHALFGRVTVAIDAQRGDFYMATYEITLEGCCELEAVRLLPRTDVDVSSGPDRWLAGPEVTRWWPAGETVFPSAAAVARLADANRRFVPGERLEPLGLRATQFVKAPPARTLPRI